MTYLTKRHTSPDNTPLVPAFFVLPPDFFFSHFYLQLHSRQNYIGASLVIIIFLWVVVVVSVLLDLASWPT